MSEILRAIPLNDSDKSLVGGNFTAQEWYATRDNGSIIARTKGSSAVSISFATSGTTSSPGDWTSPVDLGLSSYGANVPAQGLKDSMDNGFTKTVGSNIAHIAIVKVEYSSSDGQFEANINNNWEDYILPV